MMMWCHLPAQELQRLSDGDQASSLHDPLKHLTLHHPQPAVHKSCTDKHTFTLNCKHSVGWRGSKERVRQVTCGG